MILLDAIYYKKSFRASSLANQIWNNIIEEPLIYHLGILKELVINVSVDSYGYTIAIIDENELEKFKLFENKINFNHYFFYSPLASLTIDMTIKNKDEFKEDFNQTRFYYDMKDRFDAGIVDSILKIECSIKDYQKIKHSLLPSLAREIQYAILRNRMGIKLEGKDRNLIFSEFEYFFMQSEILCVNFIEHLNNEIKDEKIKSEIILIYQQIKGDK